MRVNMCVCTLCILLATAAAEQPSTDSRDVVRRVWGTDQDEFLLDTSVTTQAAPYDQEKTAVAFSGSVFLMVWSDERRDCDSADIFGTRILPDGTVLDRSSIAISLARYNQSSPAVCFDGTNFLVVWDDRRNGGEYQDIYGARVSSDGTVLDAEGFVICAADSHQRYPAAAFDGTNCLVVWDDGRTGDYDIRGARVTPEGTVLDTAGLVISQATGNQQHPDVSSDGTNYFAVWEDGRSVPSGVWGARVTPQGTVLDSLGFSLSQMMTGDRLFPAVDFDGENFLVVCDAQRHSRSDIYGARVTPGGEVLDPVGLVLSEGILYHPDLAFDGENYLVVWYDDRSLGNISGGRVATDGTVLDTAEIRITRSPRLQTNPCVAFGGTDVLVAWQDCRGDGGRPDIYGARVTPEGEVIEPDGFLISMAASGQANPTAAFADGVFLAVWQDGRDNDVSLYGARVAEDGTVLDPSGLPIVRRGSQWYPDAASLDSNFLVTWQDRGEAGIRGARVTSGGIVLDSNGVLISGATGAKRTPAVACDSARFFVVWHDARSDDGDIYGARMSADGTVLDPEGIPISLAAGSQESPSIAWDGTSFLVAWVDARTGNPDVYGARVASDGTVLDSTGFQISRGRSGERSPSVAWGDSSFLVVWEERRGLTGYDIIGARVSPAGVVLDTAGIEIAVAGGQQSVPDVVYYGAGFLVVWQDLQPGGLADIHGAFVSSEGVVLNSGPVVTQDGAQDCPKLCRGSADAVFLVYQGWAGIVEGRTYNARRVWGMMDPSTGVAGPRPVAEAAGGMLPATICRGNLVLSFGQEAVMLDITGRKVMDLKPGENDIRHVVPGVYFIREDSRIPGSKGSSRKVVIQR